MCEAQNTTNNFICQQTDTYRTGVKLRPHIFGDCTAW